MPQPIGYGLILGQRVGNERKQTHIPLKHGPYRLARALAHGPVSIGQAVERIAHGHGLPIHRNAQGGYCLIKQAAPCLRAGYGFFQQHFFHIIAKLVRAIHAYIAQVGLPAGQGRVVQFGLKVSLFQPVQFQPEEQEICRNIGQSFVNGLAETADGGIGRIRSEQQGGIRPRPPQFFLYSFKAGYGLRQFRAAQVGQTALIRLGKFLGVLCGGGKVGLQSGVIHACIQGRQIPAGQMCSPLIRGRSRSGFRRHERK